ncbi:MAG: dienelactone hydrolase family protein [Cyanobacteriota bacterium]|nr:dienelactone hydrolase family protein [Cyanobacteriota bacterium]
MTASEPGAFPALDRSAFRADWVTISSVGSHALRCWWARPLQAGPRAAVLVLPEVFGVNPWVRSVAERLAAEGYAALALPIFARTAPDFEAGYDAAGLSLGRQHRDAVTADGLLADVRCALSWLSVQSGLEGRPAACVGFCFGGHLALIAATLPPIGVTVSFYGARVSSFRPGGGAPSLSLLPGIPGDLVCICGDQDPLIPPEELRAIDEAMAATRMVGRDRRLIVAAAAGHGFMCEARSDFQPEAARLGWKELLAALERALPGD